MGWGRGPFHPSCRDSSILAGEPSLLLQPHCLARQHLLLLQPTCYCGGGRRRREITGLLLHRDVRQVRPVAGGGCGRVLAPVRETHGLGGRLGRLDQVGWPRARTTLRPRSRILLLLLSTRQPRPPLIILQLLQQEHGACIGPPIVLLQLVLQPANCSQSRACCPSSELKVMQDASSHSASK